MKDLDFKDKSSSPLYGKGMMIVIVVIFSSLSFVLGYFVGKMGRQEPAQAVVSTSNIPVPPVDSGTTDMQAAKPGSSMQNGSLSSDSQAREVFAAGQSKETPGSVTNIPAPTAEPDRNAPKQPALTAKEQLPAQRKENILKDRPAEQVSVQAKAEVYTVQLGALRRASEAKKLRQKFERKGFKTFMMITKNRKHEKIYKVRVGEFRKKKEAEILAVKLRKTEGLKAFVTVKN
jgi:cell division septation protein DedD